MSLFGLMMGGGLAITPKPVIERSEATTIVLTKPVGTASGDLLISFAMANAGVSWTAGSGFTERLDGNGAEIATLVAGGSEPASYTLTRSGAGAPNEAGTIIRLRGGAYDLVGSASSNSDTPEAPSITMSARGLLVAFFYADSAGRAFSTPAGMLPLISDSIYGSFAIFTQKVNAGATGARTSAMSGGKGYGVLLGVID